jgi:hypothetical protein
MFRRGSKRFRAAIGGSDTGEHCIKFSSKRCDLVIRGRVSPCQIQLIRPSGSVVGGPLTDRPGILSLAVIRAPARRGAFGNPQA